MNTNHPDHRPLVSIITVSYNSADTIGDTLKSVAFQEYPKLEHIIIDGLSSDATLEIVRQYPHVREVVSEKDGGIYDAMNKGIQLARGEIVGILNSDDFYASTDIIDLVVRELERSGADAFYGDLVYVARQNTAKTIRNWKAGKYSRCSFLYGWMPPHPTFFVRRHLYENLGGFNLALRTAADYELMLRFLYKHHATVTYLPRTIVKMRSGGHSNATLRHRIKANAEDRQAWKINDLQPYLFTHLLKPLRKLGQYL